MKKKIILSSLLVFAFCLTITTHALALSFKLDIGNASGGLYGTGTDGVTGLMSQISFIQNSSVIQNASGSIPDGSGGTFSVPQLGDTFTENGVGSADSMSFFTPYDDDEGLNEDPTANSKAYELTFTFTGLTGSMTNFNSDTNTGYFDFDSAGVMDVWISTPDRTPIDIENPVYVGDLLKYANGIQIASLNVTGGHGDLILGGADAGEGSTFLDATFIDNPLYYNIWLDENGEDLVKNYASLNLLLAVTDSTQKNLESTPDFPSDTTSYAFDITGNGGMEIQVVPEPATMLLLGLGLIGLAGLSRRKSFKKN